MNKKNLFIFDAIEAIDTGFTYGMLDYVPQTRGNFGCNLATEAVGACAGFLASCIAGPVAGVVVSTVSSAYLSSKAC
ncbi:MAG: hypothetical protein LIP08_00155 [Bacteroides sp.]|nr:hypothetical protein [Bacteroides sp.]